MLHRMKISFKRRCQHQSLQHTASISEGTGKPSVNDWIVKGEGALTDAGPHGAAADEVCAVGGIFDSGVSPANGMCAFEVTFRACGIEVYSRAR